MSPRRLVILTEGQFDIHDAKTAMGVIRYGRDNIVAILDSSMAGRNIGEFLPGRDIPFVATLDDAPWRPDPPRWPAHRHRADRRASCRRRGARSSSRRSRPGSTSTPACTSSSATTPSSPPRRPCPGPRLIDYRRPPDRLETTVGRRHRPGSRVILTVGTDCAIGKMSVALELVAAARRDGASGGHGPDRPDRDDDRGLGRGRRPAHQRLHQRDRGVAGRGGRGARRLGLRRGPGLARPPGLQRRDARAHPRRDTARAHPRPQAGTRPSTTSRTCPRRASRSPSSDRSSSCTNGSPG